MFKNKLNAIKRNCFLNTIRSLIAMIHLSYHLKFIPKTDFGAFKKNHCFGNVMSIKGRNQVIIYLIFDLVASYYESVLILEFVQNIDIIQDHYSYRICVPKTFGRMFVQWPLAFFLNASQNGNQKTINVSRKTLFAK